MKQLSIIFLLFSIAMTPSIANDNIDPFESINRIIYEFNDVVDDNLVEPISRTYKERVPEVAQAGVKNIFSNMRDIPTLANQILQFKPGASVTTMGRILINTTFGLLGLIDVASQVNLSKVDEDFGQTLAVWGVGEGAYIVLPLLGPSTVRDSLGLFVDTNSNTNMINKIDGFAFISTSTMNIIDKRVELLPVTDMISHSDDPYISMRSAFLQKRKFDVRDGELLDDDFEDDDF